MVARHDNKRFFGMDLSQWPRQWRAAGRLLTELPVLSLLSPAVRVQLRRSNGQISYWMVGQGVAKLDSNAADGSAHSARVSALELSSKRVLIRSLTLPPLSDADLAQALELDVNANSPFPAAQTVYGYVAQPRGQIQVAISSRAQVDLAQIEARSAGWESVGEGDPEIWVIPTEDLNETIKPIIIKGYGETARQRLATHGFWQQLALLALGAVLLAGLLVTPTALTRMRAHQAMGAADELQRKAGPQIAAREAMQAQATRVSSLRGLVGEQIALPVALDMLTRTVPDGAWLTSLRAEKSKFTLNGSADDAAALVQRLASQPGVRDARLASPATRYQGAAKENFIIELQLDPAQYGLLAGLANAAPSLGGGTPGAPRPSPARRRP
jgi:general secretion pathway protein L